jgi:hypothetical protein
LLRRGDRTRVIAAGAHKNAAHKWTNR